MTLRGLAAAAAMVFGAIGVASAVGIAGLARTLDHDTDAMESQVAGVRAAEGVERNLLIVDREDRLWRLLGDPAHLQFRQLAANRLSERLGEAYLHIEGAEERRLVAEVDSATADFLREVAKDKPDPAREQALVSRADQLASALADLNEQQAQEISDTSGRTGERAERWAIVLVALELAAIAAGIVALRSALVRPLLRLRDSIGAFPATNASRAPERGAREVREIAHAFNEASDALEKRKQRELAFLAGVAHDLRNPLGALKTTTELLARRAEDGRSVEVLRRQVDRLDRMVGDLLDRTRIEAGRLELNRARRDLREPVRAIFELHRDASPHHRLSLSLPDAPLPVEIDGQRIEQVLDNLVGNAIKYSPAGGDIALSLRASGDRGVIEVSDDGMGIAAAELETVFEPFRRSARVGTIPGLGLGLSVCRRIVEAHGGVIDVESVEGIGATFRVRLPLARQPEAEAARPGVSGSPSGDAA